MSQKIVQQISYKSNVGDSPADIPDIPLLSVSLIDDFLAKKNSFQLNDYDSAFDDQKRYPCNIRKDECEEKSLSKLMNGQSPQEFASQQIYGKKQDYQYQISQQFTLQPERQYSSFKKNDNDLMITKIEEETTQNLYTSQGNFEDTGQKTRFTALSEILMKKIMEGKEKDLPLRSHSKGKNLLNEDELGILEKQLKEIKLREESTNQKKQSLQEKQLLERLYYDKQAQIKKMQDAEKQKKNEMIQCTFSPKLISKSRSKSNNKSESYKSQDKQFYEQLTKMQEVYQSNREHLKEIKDNYIMNSVKSKPQINKNSETISQNVFIKMGIDNMSVTQRLSTLGSKKHSKKNSLISQSIENHPYHPIISNYAASKQRKASVQDELYKDAKKRMNGSCENHNNKPQQCQYNLKKQSSSKQKNHEQKFTSFFEREFKNSVFQCLQTCLPLSQISLTQSEIKKILIDLSFIKEQHSNIDQQVQTLYSQIQQNSQTKVPSKNLLVFLLACQNIVYEEDKEKYSSLNSIKFDSNQNFLVDQQSSKLYSDRETNIKSRDQCDQQLNCSMKHEKYNQFQTQHIGTFDQYGNLSLSLPQVQQVYNQFKSLSLSLLITKRRNSAHSSRNIAPVLSFAPSISDRSSKLAQEKRARIARDIITENKFEGGTLKITEILQYEQELTEIKNEEKRKKQEEERMKECCFYPQTKEKGDLKSNFNQSGLHKSLELHALAQPRNQKRDRDRGEIEYEKECDECTFAPDIYTFKRISKPNNLNDTNLAIEKNIQRIRTGRILTELNKKLAEKAKTFSSEERDVIQRLVIIDLLDVTKKDKSDKVFHQKKPNLPQVNLKTKNLSLNQTQQFSKVNSNRLDKESSNPQDKAINHSSQDIKSCLEALNNGRQIKEREGNQLDLEQEEYFLRAPINQNKQDKLIAAHPKIVEDERVPLLFVDVNIEDGKTARIVVYEGEKSEDLAIKFALEHNYLFSVLDLEETMRLRLKDLLDQQINSLLTKIDEEVGSDHEEEDEEEDKKSKEKKEQDHTQNNRSREIKKLRIKNDQIQVSSEIQNDNVHSSLGGSRQILTEIPTSNNQKQNSHISQPFLPDEICLSCIQGDKKQEQFTLEGRVASSFNSQIQHNFSSSSSLEAQQLLDKHLIQPICQLGFESYKNISGTPDISSNQISSPSFLSNLQQISLNQSKSIQSTPYEFLNYKNGTDFSIQNEKSQNKILILDKDLYQPQIQYL